MREFWRGFSHVFIGLKRVTGRDAGEMFAVVVIVVVLIFAVFGIVKVLGLEGC